MAHYAVLDEDNVVLEVLTGMDEDNTDNLPEGYEDWESWYSSLRDGKQSLEQVTTQEMACIINQTQMNQVNHRKKL